MFLRITTLLFVCFVCLFSVSVSAQQAKLNWLADAKSYLNGGFIYVNDAAEDITDNSIIVVGAFQRNADFDPSPDTFNLTAISDYDIFIAKYTKAGKLLYAYDFGGLNATLRQEAFSVAVDKQGNSYITGTFGKTIDFDPGPGQTLLSAPYSNEVFLVSFTSDGKFRYASSIAENNINETIRQIGKSIAVDDSQNVYVSGTFSGKNIDFNPGAGSALFTSHGQDIFIAKYDKTGKYIFNKVIGGNNVDEINSMQLDHENNILICGYFKSDKNDFDPGPDSSFLKLNGYNDAFFAKYDKDGNYVFAHSIGSSRFDEATSVAVASDNSFVVTGRFETKNVDFDPGPQVHALSSVLNGDVFVARYDKNGEYIFAFSLGGYGYDECSDVIFKTNNNFAFIAYLPSADVDFDPRPDSTYYIGFKNSVYAEYTIDGMLVRANGLETTGVGPQYLTMNKAGNISVTGSYNGNLDTLTGNDDGFYALYGFFVSSFDKTGKLKTVFSTDGYMDYYNATSVITSTAADAKGNIYTCGYFNGRYDMDPGPGTYYIESLVNYNESGFIAKYNADGKLLFAKVLISGPEIKDIAIDDNENIFITGNGYSSTDFDPSPGEFFITNYRFSGYYIAKYDKDGNLVFAKGESFPGGYSSCDKLELDKNNNIYICGSFDDSVDFDCGNGEYKLKSKGPQDGFIAKYTANGDFVFADQLGQGGSYAAVKDLKLSGKNEIVIIGFNSGPIDLDPGNGTYFIGKAVSGYISKYDLSGKFLSAFPFKQVDADYAFVEFFALSIDKKDNINIAGSTGGKVDFDPGTDTLLLPLGPNFFASYTSDLKLRYANPIQFSYYVSELNSITNDDNQNVYVSGYYNYRYIDVDPGPDSVILINKSFTEGFERYSEFYVVRYDSLGNYAGHLDFDADSAKGYNTTTKVVITKNNRLILTGQCESKVDFDPSFNSNYLVPTSLYSNLFVASYSLQANTFHRNIPIALNNKTKHIFTNNHAFNSQYIKQ